MRILNNGPELLLSSMLGGFGNIFSETSNVNIELDDFRAGSSLRPNIASVHGRLNEPLSSIIQGVLNKEIPLERRGHRLLLHLLMSPLSRTIAKMNASEQKRFLILHPETAEWLTQQIEKGRIALRDVILPLVENDDIDGAWHCLNRHFPDERPSDPNLVKKVADRMARVIGRNVGTVLDVDHLQAASRVSISEAASIMKPFYLHLSGPRHQGYEPKQILGHIDDIQPQIVVLEGPIPPQRDILLGRVSSMHMATLGELVLSLTGQSLVP